MRSWVDKRVLNMRIFVDADAREEDFMKASKRLFTLLFTLVSLDIGTDIVEPAAGAIILHKWFLSYSLPMKKRPFGIVEIVS